MLENTISTQPSAATSTTQPMQINVDDYDDDDAYIHEYDSDDDKFYYD